MSRADSPTPSNGDTPDTDEWIAENEDWLEDLADEDSDLGTLVDGILKKRSGGGR